MTTYTYTDPRDLDGNPYEVAAASVAQAIAAAGLLESALTDSLVMARNSDMERQIALTGEADVRAWNTNSAQGRQFAVALKELAAIQKRLTVLKGAVAYDPRHPPTC